MSAPDRRHPDTKHQFQRHWTLHVKKDERERFVGRNASQNTLFINLTPTTCHDPDLGNVDQKVGCHFSESHPSSTFNRSFCVEPNCECGIWLFKTVNCLSRGSLMHFETVAMKLT